MLENLKSFLAEDRTLASVVMLAIAIGLALVINFILAFIARIVKRRLKSNTAAAILNEVEYPLYFFILIIGLSICLPFTHFGGQTLSVINHFIVILIIIAVAWAAINIIDVAKVIILRNYDVMGKDNLHARKIITQFEVLERIIGVVIIIIAASVALMTFERVRELGASLLASAGVAGIIIGFAAQRSIATIVAGFQIALTQPIRIDDVVIVEEEWGKIEEITLSYVVIKIWDERRLIVPITYFIEKPFQNWTRVSADLLGTIFIYTDYRVQVDSLRQELTRLLKSSDKWDGRVNVVQVTNASETSVEVRALVSAADSSSAWDLRVFIREKLISFLQENYPDSLPRTRIEFRSDTVEKLTKSSG